MARRMLVGTSAPHTPVRGTCDSGIRRPAQVEHPPAQVAGAAQRVPAMTDDCCAGKKVRRTRAWLILFLLSGALLALALQAR